MKPAFSKLVQKILMLAALCFLAAVAQAQSNPDSLSTNNVKIAAKSSTATIMNIGKKYIDPNMNTDEYYTSETESIIPVLNKTIEELEQRAERQYQNNRYVIIKEED
ncbi:MAG TPA: hypothetical protein VNB90_16510 [Cytophagaceae bacterium]|jgi:TolA-binding protein|nr:hypothetical protein [Cytophagaceae bacterium]